MDATANMTDYARGQAFYVNNGKLKGLLDGGSYTADFLSGYHFEQRISRCGISNAEWFKSGRYTRVHNEMYKELHEEEQEWH